MDSFNGFEDNALTSARDMREETMFNRVVLGSIRWVMGDANGNAELIGQGLQILLENVMARIVATPTIAKEQEFLGLRIVKLAISLPPKLNRGTGKFRGVVTRANRKIADIASHIIESMRNSHAVCG